MSAPAAAPARGAALGGVLRGLTRGWHVRGVPRVLYATRRAALGGEGFYRLADGRELLLDPQDYVQCMMYYGRFTPEVTEVMRAVVRLGDAVADIGGHIGYVATFLGLLTGPGGQVHAFEPDPRARERLVANVARNRMAQVTVHPVALSSAPGSIDFYLSPHLGWSTGVAGSHLTGLTKTTVRTETLDALVAAGQVPGDLRFIKMDVEGFEPHALGGMSGVLANARPVLLSEVNPLMLRAQGEGPEQLVEQIRGHGYTVYGLRTRGAFWVRTGTRDMRRLLAPLPASLGEWDGDVVCFPRERDPFA